MAQNPAVGGDQLSTLNIRLDGASPLLMHSTTGMDPTNPLAREIRALTSKQSKQKTDEDGIEIQRMEFILGLYRNAEGPVIKSDMLLAAIRDGAKQMRQGREITRSVFCFDLDLPLIYDGPKTSEGLWKDKRFVDARSVKLKAARVLRTRPIFTDWALEAELHFDADYLNRDDLCRAIRVAGSRVGIGDYRPIFGRFDVAFL
jgi:hypothetical protein